jgi:glycosyltransferase involved in cell wall biosynthesis
VRVGYTLEQCWHRVPGGTAVAALEVARELSGIASGEVQLVGITGTHAQPAPAPWTPPVPCRSLRGHGARLYASWVFLGRPRPESVDRGLDLVHATTIIPPPTRRPLVMTVHDLAFLHDPAHFTRWGRVLFRRSLQLVRRRADLVLCSSEATMRDCAAVGVPESRLRHVPLGVRAETATTVDVSRVREAYALPAEYLLFVGTVEPRKNLGRLVEAVVSTPSLPPLVVAGSDGWGDVAASLVSAPGRARLLGFVPAADLPGLYAGAAAFCFPSIREGFGLPVLEAMAQGTPVVTSACTSTEEVAGGAAVLVDPRRSTAIAAGLAEALERRDELAAAGRRRAATCTWAATAARTLDAYRELCP